MVVEIACTCDDLPAHSHVYETVRRGNVLDRVRTAEVRIWVDWKAVARALATEGTASA